MLPISSVASVSFQFSFFSPQLETRNQQPTLALVTRTISIGNIKTLKRRHKAQDKKVRSGRCFAAHLLFVYCAGFGRMVRRAGLGVAERL